jgi:predicted RNA binding protein YcfA (HicA-like mRNA interferase family)
MTRPLPGFLSQPVFVIYIIALEKDGWQHDITSGASQAYRNPATSARVTIHVHPGKTYGAKLLKGLLEDIGWSEDDLKRLKIVK